MSKFSLDVLQRRVFPYVQSEGPDIVLGAALSTPLGTLVSFPFINRIDQATLGNWLAISAGALVYVGASHLLPAVEQERKRYSLLALIAGVVVAVGIVLTKR